MLAVMLASIAANDWEGESTRKVGGVNFQLTAKVLQPVGAKGGILAVSKQLQLIFYWKQ